MGSVNISIKKEAYEFLKSLKAEDESFSDVILELRENKSSKKGSFEAIMDCLNDFDSESVDWEEFESRIRKNREKSKKRMQEIHEYMGKR